jgi:hypothetical protein
VSRALRWLDVERGSHGLNRKILSLENTAHHTVYLLTAHVTGYVLFITWRKIKKFPYGIRIFPTDFETASPQIYTTEGRTKLIIIHYYRSEEGQI